MGIPEIPAPPDGTNVCFEPLAEEAVEPSREQAMQAFAGQVEYVRQNGDTYDIKTCEAKYLIGLLATSGSLAVVSEMLRTVATRSAGTEMLLSNFGGVTAGALGGVLVFEERFKSKMQRRTGSSFVAAHFAHNFIRLKDGSVALEWNGSPMPTNEDGESAAPSIMSAHDNLNLTADLCEHARVSKVLMPESTFMSLPLSRPRAVQPMKYREWMQAHKGEKVVGAKYLQQQIVEFTPQELRALASQCKDEQELNGALERIESVVFALSDLDATHPIVSLYAKYGNDTDLLMQKLSPSIREVFYRHMESGGKKMVVENGSHVKTRHQSTVHIRGQNVDEFSETGYEVSALREKLGITDAMLRRYHNGDAASSPHLQKLLHVWEIHQTLHGIKNGSEEHRAPSSLAVFSSGEQTVAHAALLERKVRFAKRLAGTALAGMFTALGPTVAMFELEEQLAQARIEQGLHPLEAGKVNMPKDKRYDLYVLDKAHKMLDPTLLWLDKHMPADESEGSGTKSPDPNFAVWNLQPKNMNPGGFWAQDTHTELDVTKGWDNGDVPITELSQLPTDIAQDVTDYIEVSRPINNSDGTIIKIPVRKYTEPVAANYGGEPVVTMREEDGTYNIQLPHDTEGTEQLRY